MPQYVGRGAPIFQPVRSAFRSTRREAVVIVSRPNSSAARLLLPSADPIAAQLVFFFPVLGHLLPHHMHILDSPAAAASLTGCCRHPNRRCFGTAAYTGTPGVPPPPLPSRIKFLPHLHIRRHAEPCRRHLRCGPFLAYSATSRLAAPSPSSASSVTLVYVSCPLVAARRAITPSTLVVVVLPR